MDNILEVKNLKISFRTSGGKLQAVRDISFNLERGKALAIVGESGSGKSVTSKAILGILAGNSIVDGGEILFDGKDLLKIDEEEMYKIRGDKIAMIFQDPLSSLNPIVKIGKQITEAMLLKNKASRKSSRKEFNAMLSELEKNMIAASGEDRSQEIKKITKDFDAFCIVNTKLEDAYNDAKAHAEELISDVNTFLFNVEKKQKVSVKSALTEFSQKLATVKNQFLTRDHDAVIAGCVSVLASDAKAFKPASDELGQPIVDGEIVKHLNVVLDTLKEVLGGTKPNFFRIAYYVHTNPNYNFDGMTIEAINDMTLKYLDDNFMTNFREIEAAGIRYSFDKSLEGKKEVLAQIDSWKEYYVGGNFDKKGAANMAKEAAKVIDASIDRLAINKDSAAYTFKSTLDDAIEKYFFYKEKNPKEEARFARQSKKREALIAKGKTVDWKVTPKAIIPLDELLSNIGKIFDRIKANYEADVLKAFNFDEHAYAVSLIDYFKEKASASVYMVTKKMAKEKAISLMEEVGIPEPRVRFNQYPFEFSGGMRQRIVIAIALSANPDILICDEPTTALDVTIQAQILELINDLKNNRNLSVIFITHDLGVVANIADEIAVMYAGKIVEYGTVDDIFYDPRHPYTWALLSSMPDLDTEEKLEAIPGTPPNMIYPPEGDAFAARNKYALKIDYELQPPLFDVSDTHKAATWLLHPDAPEVTPPAIITERIARMKKLGGAQ